MPHEMNEFNERIHKDSQVYTPEKNTTDFVIKLTMSDSVCCLFAIDKGNSCLFETCL